MNIAKSTLKLMVARGANALLLFLGLSFFARRLAPEVMGIFFLFQTLLGLLTIPADFGLNGAIEKRLSEGSNRGRIHSAGFVSKLGFAIPVSILVFLFRDSVNSYLGAEIAWLLGLTILIQEVGKFFLHILHGELRVGDTAVIYFGRVVVWAGLGVVLLSVLDGVLPLVVSLSVSYLALLVLSFARSRPQFDRPARGDFSSLFSFSKYKFISSNIGWHAYNWVDIALIGFFLTQAKVSAYELAWQVSMLVMVVISAVAQTIFPQLSKWTANEQSDRVEILVKRALSFMFFISIPTFYGGLVTAPDILEHLFGREYASFQFVLLVFLAEKTIRVFQEVFYVTIEALDRPDITAKTALVSLFVNVSLNVILITRFGIVGAAVATTLAVVTGAVINGYHLTKMISLDIPVRRIQWYNVSAGIMFLLLLYLESKYHVRSVQSLLVLVLVGIAIYLPIAICYKPVRDDFVHLVRR